MQAAHTTVNHIYNWLCSSFKKDSTGTECYISRLPPDVFLDDLFPHLQIEDIIRLRLVNRAFYVITHEPIIWRRFLQRLHIPRLQLRPTFKYHHHSNSYDIEMLVTQACAVDKAWRRGFPELQFFRHIEAHHKIVDLKLLPGGKFLVASVKDRCNYRFHIFLYVLDDPNGCRLLARLPTDYKTFDLQAKYMSYFDVPGIMISFTRRRFAHGAAVGHDVNDYSHRNTIDPAAELLYEAFCFHIRLDNLEELIDNELKSVKNQQYKRLLASMPPPFIEVVRYETFLEIHSPALFEHNSVPALALVAGTSEIIVIDIHSMRFASMKCSDHLDYTNGERHRIRAIRPFPGQSDEILVVRTVSTRPNADDVVLFETYAIPQAQGDIVVSSLDSRLLPRACLSNFVISDPGLPLQKNAPDHPDIISEEECPPTLWIFAENSNPRGLAFFHIRPQQKMTWSQEAGEGYVYRYGVDNISKTLLHCSAPNVEHVIPGAERSLIYTVAAGDRTESPQIFKMRRFVPHSYDETFPPIAPIESVLDRPEKSPMAFTDIFKSEYIGHQVSKAGGLAAITWDENSGRICVASDQENVIRVLDFCPIIVPQERIAFKWRHRLHTGV